jgi:hypothetical protein
MKGIALWLWALIIILGGVLAVTLISIAVSEILDLGLSYVGVGR